jgi:serine/threonine kinase PknH
MRRFTAAALAGICVLAAACGGSNSSAPAASSAKSGAGGSTTSTPPPPVAVSALDGLLLSVDQINTAMGATGMTVIGSTYTKLGDDTAIISDKNCLADQDAGELPVYTGSGYSAVRSQSLQQPDKLRDYVDQNVILFPDATSAAAFFTASPAQWQSCANRQFTQAPTGQVPGVTWTAGAVSNTNGTLSVRKTQEGNTGWSCQHALTVRNNVAVDVSACSYNQGDLGINIAQQIAAKVPTQ